MNDFAEYGVWGIVILSVIGGILTAGTWIGKVNTDRKTFRDFMNEVRGDIKKILNRLPASTIQRGSPLMLNELGKKVAECLEAHEMVNSIFDDAYQNAQGKPAFDVQQMCFDYVLKDWEPPDNFTERIKDCAYKHGIDRKQTMNVIAIQLRDRILEKREKKK